jgi:PAS domain S-box-containing protein
MTDTAKTIELLERRYRLLRTISNLNTDYSPGHGHTFILDKCCSLLMQDTEYCLCWVGKWDDDKSFITPVALATSTTMAEKDCYLLVEQVLIDNIASNPVARALNSEQTVIIPDVISQSTMPTLKKIARMTGFRSCCSIPISYHNTLYGVLTIHSKKMNGFAGSELDFVNNVVTDIGSALYANDTTHRLQIERDFNSEIFDTVQALLVSISHCGEILSFNRIAEQITGFREEEIKKKYWVDVLMDKESRRQSQQLLTKVLKHACSDINFQSVLRTKSGDKRTIDWHGSICQHIEKGKVGMVLFGTDITNQLATTMALNQERAKWQNIFSAMQDPILIVSRKGIILDANPATLKAARKKRNDVVGKTVCDILHGGRQSGVTCPLETHLSTGASRILETELQGLHGNYLLTINPLHNFDGNQEAALLLARDLTEEEQIKAKALRAAQLAATGELAAGVAHEINNPINGIINYAQILKDILPDNLGAEYLANIVHEGKRIASITSNLLDFAKKNEESPEPVNAADLINHCLQLVNHQFNRDGIEIRLNLDRNIPFIMCNPQQIQQVLFNVFSNARYALNEKYPGHDPEKIIDIRGQLREDDTFHYVRLTVTDRGTGIKHDILDRLMDPFFSTKPSGQGTGLGLSISQGLVKGNGGYFSITSKWKSHTTITIDLPVAQYP